MPPSGLQLRPMEERAPKPMRSAYGSQVEQFFAPSMRKWYGEEDVDRRVDVMQSLYEEHGSPQFVEIPEDSPRGGSYNPWTKKVNLKRSDRFLYDHLKPKEPMNDELRRMKELSEIDLNEGM